MNKTSHESILILREQLNVCHIEFNIRKYSIRDAILITKLSEIGEIVDIITDSKVHLIVINDCYECVYMRSVIMGMNVYEREALLFKDDCHPTGITVVKFKNINYFTDELRIKYEDFCKEVTKRKKVPKTEKKLTEQFSKMDTGGRKSPDASSDEFLD